jgi:SAM-dependent methyltransferase
LEVDRLKRSVVSSPLSEAEVRPPGVYAGLVEACLEAAASLREAGGFAGLTACPACGGAGFRPAFGRRGFAYLECEGCWSILASPRPGPDAARRYQHDSAAASHRRDPAYQAEVGARLREAAEARAEAIAFVARGAGRVVLVEPRNAYMVPALARLGVKEVACVDPLPPFDRSVAEGSSVHPSLGQLPAEAWDVVVLDDVLEHTADPAGLLADAYGRLRPGGHLLASTRCATGFDVQTLWEDADVFPLEHITLLSVDGARRLLERAGFELRELSTPGLLDLQVIERVAKARPSVRLPRFLRALFERGDRLALERLQAYLQENRLSSHLRVVARRAAEGA